MSWLNGTSPIRSREVTPTRSPEALDLDLDLTEVASIGGRGSHILGVDLTAIDRHGDSAPSTSRSHYSAYDYGSHSDDEESDADSRHSIVFDLTGIAATRLEDRRKSRRSEARKSDGRLFRLLQEKDKEILALRALTEPLHNGSGLHNEVVELRRQLTKLESQEGSAADTHVESESCNRVGRCDSDGLSPFLRKSIRRHTEQARKSIAPAEAAPRSIQTGNLEQTTRSPQVIESERPLDEPGGSASNCEPNRQLRKTKTVEFTLPTDTKDDGPDDIQGLYLEAEERIQSAEEQKRRAEQLWMHAEQHRLKMEKQQQKVEEITQKLEQQNRDLGKQVSDLVTQLQQEAQRASRAECALSELQEMRKATGFHNYAKEAQNAFKVSEETSKAAKAEEEAKEFKRERKKLEDEIASFQRERRKMELRESKLAKRATDLAAMCASETARAAQAEELLAQLRTTEVAPLRDNVMRLEKELSALRRASQAN